MLRNSLRIVLAIAVVGICATTGSAGNMGLVDNGDIELVNRFAPWGDPDDGDPNTPFAGSTPTGRPDAWHHSATPTAVWSDPTSFYGGPHAVTSGIYALWLEDPLFSAEAEFRSYAGDSACCLTPTRPDVFTPEIARTGNIPGVGSAGRILTVGWDWDWSITSGTVFTGTVRVSSAISTGLDLTDGGDPNNITEYNFSTTGASSGGYVSFSTDIPLAASDAQFDIIFNTSDRTLDLGIPAEAALRLGATGTMFVDSVHAALPEPSSLLLLSISGLMVMGRRRRC